MKIISCHIENFGALKDRDYKFSDGLCEFIAENGAGKTTLAAFIRAMFYGLPATRSNARGFDARRRYYPFDGGKFGGNLTFSKGGDVYRVERFFDMKSEVRDRLTVYKNGEITPCGDVGGLAFDGLDEAAFSRTLYVTGDDIDGGAEGLGERICGKMFVGDVSFNDALAALDERRKGLKVRGGGGAIDRKKAEIAGLRDEIAGLEAIDAALGGLYGDRRAKLGEIAELEREEGKLNEFKVVAERWARYDGYIADLDRAKEKIAELDGKFPAGVPNGEEIAFCRENLKKYGDNAAEIKSRTLSETKAERLASLKERFRGGVPSAEEFGEAERRLGAVSVAEAEAGKLNDDGGERAEKLADTFRRGLPSEEEKRALNEAYASYTAGAAPSF